MSKLNEYAILYVDDEAMSLKYFEKQFSTDFHVHTASNAADAWEIMQKQPGKIGVLMSDQRMPGQTGVQLLEKVRHHFPEVIRILVTAYSDIDSAVAGINASGIYKYISKPWDVTDLKFTLLRALEYYGVLNERDQLLREKLSVLQQIVVCDRAKNLGVLAAGLSAHFRHALRAANSFVAAIPSTAVQLAAKENVARDSAKNIEQELQRASEDIHHLARGMKELAEEAPLTSAAALPLETLLAPFTQAQSSNPSNPVALKCAGSLPKIKASQKQITKLFGLIAANLRATVEGNVAMILEAKSGADAKGVAGIHLQFSDDGPDWTPEQRARFFAPFTSFKHEGARFGLDLAMAYFIVHHHGGRISVAGQSKSRVAIELPADPLKGDPDDLNGSQLSELFRQDLGFA